MSKYSKAGKIAPCGSIDSKYFRKPNQFDEDVARKIQATDEFKENIKNLMLENPSLIKHRCDNVIEVLLEIKEKYL